LEFGEGEVSRWRASGACGLGMGLRLSGGGRGAAARAARSLGARGIAAGGAGESGVVSVHEEECEATAEEFWGSVRGFFSFGGPRMGNCLAAEISGGEGWGRGGERIEEGKEGKKKVIWRYAYQVKMWCLREWWSCS